MNQNVDAAFGQLIGRDLISKNERKIGFASRQRLSGRTARHRHDGPPGTLERLDQTRTDITVRARDRGPLHAAVPMRWAFAITVSVMVVAGTLGSTVASTACTRSNPWGLPRGSDSKRPGCRRIGNVPPL